MKNITAKTFLFLLTILAFSLSSYSHKRNNEVIKSPVDINIGGEVVTFLPVYPNPASHSLTIKYVAREEAGIEIRISNVIGTTVHHINTTAHVGEHSLNYSIENIPAGVYFITYAVRGTTVKTERLIIRS